MTLPSKIFNLISFKRQFKDVLIKSCVSSFSNVITSEKPNEIDWNNLISCASILSQSDSYEHQEASLRIAQCCLEDQQANEEQKIACTIILDNLTNRPAIKLAISRNHISKNFSDKIPLPFIYDITRRKIDHTILTKTKEIYLNKFQKEAYRQFRTVDVVSVSAPTSAGKSFVLYQTLVQLITESIKPINIIYIVPTRALISQVERDFRSIIEEDNLTNVLISTVPKLDVADIDKTNIYIFTQERLHWFKIENPSFIFDYIIIDEAQKISEGNRGILLQQKVEEILESCPNIKIFYSSPLTLNPEILYNDIENPFITKSVVKTEFVAVNQNLIYVAQAPGNTKKWNLDLCILNDTISLGSVLLANRPTTEIKRIAFLANRLTHQEDSSIIYMNGAALAERLANVLYDEVQHDCSDNEEIKNLIDFCTKTVHKDFLLNKVLTRRIAFHYGNMPLLIRQEIEKLFEKGIIKYLICTSTLLEGVNLPAKNIFLKNPTRGTGKPLSNSDFWNLAGRAGRLGKEFQGNIICIDPTNWERQPSLTNKRQEIKKSIDKIADSPNDFLAYLSNGTPREEARKTPDLDYAFTYYYSHYLEGTLSKTLTKKPVLFFNLVSEFDKISTILKLPNQIIFRNPGISPIAQQNLFNHFQEKHLEIEKYIPYLPESDDAVQNSYLTIIGNISKYFSGDSQLLNYYYAILVVNWMRGQPLSVLIKKSYDYYQRPGIKQKKKLDQVIRDTMKDVEEFARFKFAKYSACYVDILRYYLSTTDKASLVNEIPDLHIWLEFGVSQGTQVSLISLGLSRQSAITLSEFIANDSFTKEECKNWILRTDLNSLQITQLVINEITDVLKLKNKFDLQ